MDYSEIMGALAADPAQNPLAQTIAPEDSPLNQPVREVPDNRPPVVDPDAAPMTGGLPHEQMFLADMILGGFNNMVALGAGFFINIKKDDDMIEFSELVQVIDQQNEKNVRRLLLDEDDKAMLRPLLAMVLAKRAVEVTPEQQLLMAACTIIIKKVGVMSEIRKENAMLSNQIRSIIREELNAAKAPDQVPPVAESIPKPQPVSVPIEPTYVAHQEPEVSPVAHVDMEENKQESTETQSESAATVVSPVEAPRREPEGATGEAPTLADLQRDPQEAAPIQNHGHVLRPLGNLVSDFENRKESGELSAGIAPEEK